MIMKTKIVYVCQTCGFKSIKWIGKCPDCDSWNSMVAEEVMDDKRIKRRGEVDTNRAVLISDVALEELKRIETGLTEFDRVMGGGVVKGSFVLIGGEPGIGKSTILTQVLNEVSLKGFSVLYVTAEESLSQVKIRADRLGAKSQKFYICAENSLTAILKIVDEIKPDFVVIDSIQTIYLDEIPSAPGSVSQVRECAAKIMELAKKKLITTFVVGHVTKEGYIAGPRVLEHLVDTVIYFEGDKGQNFRLLRTVKNRFGSTNEVGLFQMSESGLEGVANLSEFFLSDRVKEEAGSATFVAMEGTRPIVVEIQALVAQSNFGVPRRMAMGVDNQRLNLLVAVLEKKIELPLFNNDIYINVVGGLKLTETASDLAISLAIASSFKNIPLKRKTIFLGEIGLLGEIRSVSNIEARLKEAANLDFDTVVLPKKIKNFFFKGEVIAVDGLKEAMELCFLR